MQHGTLHTQVPQAYHVVGPQLHAHAHLDIVPCCCCACQAVCCTVVAAQAGEGVSEAHQQLRAAQAAALRLPQGLASRILTTLAGKSQGRGRCMQAGRQID